MSKVQEDIVGDKEPKQRLRGWGEGTIIERKDQKGNIRYLAQVWSGGKRHAKALSTRPEAQRWIRQTISSGEEGTLPVDGGKTTVKAFLAHWLETKRVSIKPKTYDLYEYTIRLHLEPELGPKKLIELRADHLQRLYAAKLKKGAKTSTSGDNPKGLSPRTVQIAHRLIHGALADAVRWNLVPRNVADAAIAPKPRRSELKVWTSAEATRFLNATADDRLGPAYVILLNCGLRLGELLALRWEDIDFDGRRIQVRRTIQRLKRGQGLVVGEPKSAQGRRHLLLSNQAVEALRRWRVRQKEERLQAGPSWTESGYVFASSVGTAMEPRNFHRSFDNTVERLGLPAIRVHDLRHTCATILLSKGVHPKVVQELLGHGQISLTLDTYSHVLPTMQEDAARTLEAVYGAS